LRNPVKAQPSTPST